MDGLSGRVSYLQYENADIKNIAPSRTPIRPLATDVPSLFPLARMRKPSREKPSARPAKLDAVIIFANRLCVFICVVFPSFAPIHALHQVRHALLEVVTVPPDFFRHARISIATAATWNFAIFSAEGVASRQPSPQG